MRYRPHSQSWHGSPTDLADHARCDHLVQLSRAHARDVVEGRAEDRAATGLSLERGREFEAAWVAARRGEVEAAGGRFLDVREAAPGDPRRQRVLLERALRDGVELIAQAPLRSGDVFGYADLLERIADVRSPTGPLGTPHRYEPVEIKYGRSVRVEYVLQACTYADALGQLLGAPPRRMHLVTGDGTRHELLAHEHIEYWRAARERFSAALELDLDEQLAHVPDPVTHCVRCDFATTCGARRSDADHLALVAGIRADQRTKLAAEGITTLTQLATSELERVARIGPATLERLRTQARLQLESRSLDPSSARVAWRDPASEPNPAGRGFAMLPAPDDDDMFFDFEGYPYHERGALEYLWGWTSRDEHGAMRFDYLWADTPAEEAAAFSAFLDEVHARRERSPGMHVFHYAPYEITALRRLAHEHHHEQWRLDSLLRAGVFVDLYAVVRQSMQIGTSSYSIKSLEPLYGIDRSGDELADGGSSIDVYEQWLTDGDERVRSTILEYNQVDCDSTLALRDWLLDRRDDARADGIEWPNPPRAGEPDEATDAAPVEADESDSDAPHPTRVLVERLEQLAEDEQTTDAVRLAARLLSAMPGWQRRVRREFFGDLYGRMHERDELDDVLEPRALAGLQLQSTEPTGRGSTLRTYSFPDQVTLVKAGQDAIDPTSVRTVGEVVHVDLDSRTVSIKTTPGTERRLAEQAAAAGERPDQLPRSIVGWDKIPIDRLEPAARTIGERLLATLDSGGDPFAPDAPDAAALSMLARHATRVVEGVGPQSLADDPDPERLADLVRRARGSHVIVQGPPGTGKTWTSARLIVALVEAGMRVGISSNSHDAVINVLRGIDEHRAERTTDGRPLELRCAYALRTGEKTPGTLEFGEEWIERPRSTRDAATLLRDGDAQILAGSAWQFVQDAPLDVVLIDEAGQVSLLHATAIASQARTVVLVGDPQQLPQPSDAQHPFGCGASVLEHLFGGASVLEPDRALLLPVTRRLHPRVCDFISSTYYDGALHPHPSTVVQHVTLPGSSLPSAGTHLLRVEHRDNRSSSPEEVEAIRLLVDELLDRARTVPHPDHPERPLRATDILVVAPYNAQRRLLEAALPSGVAVGTVDRFQGQEAPVTILSMTASSREQLPRGLEFLLDPHRLNVGISRARALAVVVASPALLATSAANLVELRLLNDLQRLARSSTADATASTTA